MEGKRRPKEIFTLFFKMKEIAVWFMLMEDATQREMLAKQNCRSYIPE